jgi:DNA ligase-1
MKQLPILFSRTSTGAIQQWQIIVEGNTFYTVEGIKDGKMTKAIPTVCEGKNIGKANETTGEEQAVKESKSKWKKKIDSGYFENIKDIDNKTFTEPMLAKNYEDEFDKSMFPVYSERKYDGMRSVALSSSLTSRNGKPIIAVPHILEALSPFFKKHPNAELDGELYTHQFCADFNKIISLVKKTKPTAADIAEAAKYIQYHVYDYISMGKENFSVRYKALQEDLAVCDSNIICVVPAVLCNNQEELDAEYTKYMELGYEGQMIRLDKPYEHKRSKYLLKRKEFKDSEYEIVEVVEGVGNRSGTAGFMIMKMADGRTFKSNIKGSFDYLKELLSDKKSLIGKKATVKYFCLTPDGIPRFPYVITVRDYE